MSIGESNKRCKIDAVPFVSVVSKFLHHCTITVSIRMHIFQPATGQRIWMGGGGAIWTTPNNSKKL